MLHTSKGERDMTRKRLDEFLGKKVALTFQSFWFNEAVQEWVDTEEEPLIGVLVRCECPEQTHLYCLESIKPLPTDNACWSANRVESVREIQNDESNND